jgi:FAD/FMN-containing dehydrogenase
MSRAVQPAVSLFDRLVQVVGSGGALQGDDVGPRYSQNLRGGEPRGVPPLVLRPTSTAEVAEVLRLCNEAGQAVVPQGGMTGLVGGGVPDANEVVLSLERMDRIEQLDPVDKTMTVQAGAVLQTVQETAEEHGLIFPLDLGSRGSCTIGGCLAANAGGNRVLLYGMMRELVLGVEAVLADGTIVGGLHKLPKNNAGYDLRHLFIGTEGTLGVVTRAVLRLRPKPASQLVAFCGLRSFGAAVELLHGLQARLPGRLSAFEMMWDSAYALVLDKVRAVRAPFPSRHPFYVLAECQGADPEADAERFLAALEEHDRLLADVVVGQSPKEARDLWAVRESIPEAVLSLRPFFGYDVSLPVGDMEPFLERVSRELRQRWPNAYLIPFGHLGDGNLHVTVITGANTRELKSVVDELVFRTISLFQGSISAEHGIGFEKRPYLRYCRTPEEIDLMRRLKRCLDPNNVLSPGRVFLLDGGD